MHNALICTVSGPCLNKLNCQSTSLASFSSHPYLFGNLPGVMLSACCILRMPHCHTKPARCKLKVVVASTGENPCLPEKKTFQKKADQCHQAGDTRQGQSLGASPNLTRNPW